MTLDLVLIFPMLEDKLGFSDNLARYWASLAAWGALGIHLSLPHSAAVIGTSRRVSFYTALEI